MRDDMTTDQHLRVDIVKECHIVFIHFYSASNRMSLSKALPTTAIDTVGVYMPKPNMQSRMYHTHKLVPVYGSNFIMSLYFKTLII